MLAQWPGGRAGDKLNNKQLSLRNCLAISKSYKDSLSWEWLFPDATDVQVAWIMSPCDNTTVSGSAGHVIMARNVPGSLHEKFVAALKCLLPHVVPSLPRHGQVSQVASLSVRQSVSGADLSTSDFRLWR